ncbi:MAG: glutamate 5-kinase [Acidimicrobiales bacterium]|nr:glutamate 5-kinase [Acidimicrobiales bacterium]MDG1878851.1 glutamate 5-kinase [Acidimicrobiales bacterium]
MNAVVVKIGTSSLTDEEGVIDASMVARLARQVVGLRADGHNVVLVTSAAIAAGLPELGLGGVKRPSDPITLQAVATVGQSALMEVYRREFAGHGVVAGQVLLVPHDFIVRAQYLHARQTLGRLLELGVVPIVNENDAIADDEIRWGDNDRLAALVANLVDADRLVLLTDTEGLLTADPRIDQSASLIEEIHEIEHQHEELAGGAGSVRGSGGMASKLAAAKIAAWSGVDTVIAAAVRDGVVADAVAGVAGVGTSVRARTNRLPARKAWIAFAVVAQGQIVVDIGARRALEDGKSLLAAGVQEVIGSFDPGAPIEILDTDGQAFAKGLVRHGADEIVRAAGHRSDELPLGAPAVVVHADDLVALPQDLTRRQ